MVAAVIIDIQNRQVDRAFSYLVPEELKDKVRVGSCVQVPFGAGNRLRTGYVVDLVEEVKNTGFQLKYIDSVPEKSLKIEEQLISLAAWMRYRYGGTFYQSLSVVLPNKVKIEPNKERFFVFSGTEEDRRACLSEAQKKKYYARVRLLEAFEEKQMLPAEIVTDRLSITNATLKPLMEKGLIQILFKDNLPLSDLKADEKKEAPVLNEKQMAAVSGIENTDKAVSLLFGVTGSGKTEVYLRLIEDCLKEGKQAIVLIPEIALTYQTVMRFYDRFGDLVSVVHSRLSSGEKCERFLKASEGKIRVMIGPRSALFTPFPNLGLVIIDEFHESSYLSEQVPRYKTVETAEERVRLCRGKLVLGSATPTVEVYERALKKEIACFEMKKRAVSGAILPDVRIIDMREELKNGNRSVFSIALREKIREKLERKEQVMLFLNRRGYSGAISCRLCGKPIVCPHCSVSLNYHRDGTMRCHFCGYVRPVAKTCPACGSNLIGTFGIGTEKVEEMVKEAFPDARTLRMDADTTAGKDGHQKILEKFMNHEADVLIGTQMIVKGHDFPEVTLVGILAADLSLNVPDYLASERTFQLLTQAEGRAGRGKRPGECIVQTYNPEHYAVFAASKQDYASFFESEMIFRRQMKYPPCGAFIGVTIAGMEENELKLTVESMAKRMKSEMMPGVTLLGPVEHSIYKVKDRYRMTMCFKAPDKELLLLTKRRLEEVFNEVVGSRKIYLTFEA